MPNPLQKIRSDNMVTVRKMVAKSMPTGILDEKLKALLSVQFGFGDSTIAEYLQKLSDAGVIEEQEGVWRVL